MTTLPEFYLLDLSTSPLLNRCPEQAQSPSPVIQRRRLHRVVVSHYLTGLIPVFQVPELGVQIEEEESTRPQAIMYTTKCRLQLTESQDMIQTVKRGEDHIEGRAHTEPPGVSFNKWNAGSIRSPVTKHLPGAVKADKREAPARELACQPACAAAQVQDARAPRNLRQDQQSKCPQPQETCRPPVEVIHICDSVV